MMNLQDTGKPPRNYATIPMFLREIGYCFGNYRSSKDSLNSYAVLSNSLGMLMPNDPGTWSEWEIALKAYATTSWSTVHGISYVVQREHEIVVIDLDPPKPRNKVPHFDDAQYARYVEVTTTFNNQVIQFFAGKAYIEYSASGVGVHIFIGGTVPPFLNLPTANKYNLLGGGSVFVHGQCINLTGNKHPLSGFTIEPGQDYINNFIGGMIESQSIVAIGADDTHKNEQRSAFFDQTLTTLGRRDDLTDEQVLERYFSKNKKEHPAIYEGRQDFYGRMSQTVDSSNGDHLLIGELDKITALPDQILRIVLNSPRCAEEKRQRKIVRIFDDELDRQRISNNKILADLASNNPTMQQNMQALITGPGSLAYATTERQQEFAATLAEMEAEAEIEDKGDYDPTPAFQVDLPPGLLGLMANEYLAMSVYPNQTMAVAWAFALVAGIAQRSYHIGGLGVSLYTMVLAETGSGKEWLGKAATQLFNETKARHSSNGQLHSLHELIGPSIFASGQAMYKNIAAKPRQFITLNEATFLFESMQDGKDRNGREKKAALLDLKTKADKHSFLNSYAYADSEKNVSGVHMPSQTILGEGQPDKFFSAIDGNTAEDGLLSRFIFFDASRNYRGPMNENRPQQFSFNVIDNLLPLFEKVMHMPHDPNIAPDAISVDITPEAEQLFRLFNKNVIGKLSVAADKIRHNLFNRCFATGRVLAALMAIAENPNRPIVDHRQALYALTLLKNERDYLYGKFERNEVGGSESVRDELVKKAIRQLMTKPSRAVTPEMLSEGIFPFYAIRKLLVRKTAFADKGGNGKSATTLVEASLRNLENDGAIKNVTGSTAILTLAGKTGVFYQIYNLR